MEQGPTTPLREAQSKEKIELHGASYEQAASEFMANDYNTGIKVLNLNNPSCFKPGESTLRRAAAFIRLQNSIKYYREVDPDFNPFLFTIKYLKLLNYKIRAGQLDIGASQGLTQVSVSDCDQMDPGGQKALFESIDLNYQKILAFTNFQFSPDTFAALCTKLATASSTCLSLDLSYNDFTQLDLKPLIQGIRENRIKVKTLILDETILSISQRVALLDALLSNDTTETLRGLVLPDAQTKHLYQNWWLNGVKEKNKFDNLNLQDQYVIANELPALARLIEHGQYRKVHLTHSHYEQEELKPIADVLLKNSKLTSFTFYGQNSPEAREIRKQVNINKSIKKIFGIEYPYLSRNTFMYGMFGGNFVYSIAVAVVSPFALAYAAAGFMVMAGLRIASNAYFHKQLLATKAEGYFDNKSNQERYECGREAAKTWSPWFQYKSWTTAGYLGYIQEKNHLDSPLDKHSHIAP